MADPSKAADKIEVQNVISPGHVTRVDARKYHDMRRALLKILPGSAPGLTVAEAKDGLLPHLSQDLFPGGDKAGWWLKCVQLDLEAKGLVGREATKPLRLHRTDEV